MNTKRKALISAMAGAMLPFMGLSDIGTFSTPSGRFKMQASPSMPLNKRGLKARKKSKSASKARNKNRK